MNSRNTILKKLRAAATPFTEVAPVEQRRKMVPLVETTPDALTQRFIAEAEKIGCRVYAAEDAASAFERIFALLNGDKQLSAWDDTFLPVPEFSATLKKTGVEITAPDNRHVRVGITGVDAGLASTGSLVFSSGQGKYRTVSLLPTVYVAIMTTTQIVADLESWVTLQKERGLDLFRQSSNTVIISGPSKTADIAQELILGAHGPKEVHIILLP
jgi:L-lactate dehydrogenase complex protein LldG